jgi:UDP-glucuronate 4-epimerase
VVAAIEAAAPDARGLVTFDDVPLPFPEELPGERLAAQVTPLDVAVRETIEHFRSADRHG